MNDTAWYDTAVACRDPECPGVAEPEQDGDTYFHACVECGYEFNFRIIRTTTVAGTDTCAIGVPESVRRSASITPGGDLPLLQIGRRRADTA